MRNKLDQPLPLGYCNSGVVLEIGEGVTGFSVDDRVVSNGPHAEMLCSLRARCQACLITKIQTALNNPAFLALCRVMQIENNFDIMDKT